MAHAGLVAAHEREWAAQAAPAAATNSAAAVAAALQAATTACSRAELEARLLRDELAAADGAVAVFLEREAGRHAAEIGTMTDTVVLNLATQTALTDNTVDISTAEAMVAEALCMADEVRERERAADERARLWLAQGRARQ